MILLVANPGPARSALTAFLDRARLPSKAYPMLDGFLEEPPEAPRIHLAVIEYRAAGRSSAVKISNFIRMNRDIPAIVMGAPISVEADLLRAGAVAVLGPGCSLRSVSLQCANLLRLTSRRNLRSLKAMPKPTSDFRLGDAWISPEKRLLRKTKFAGDDSSVRITKLELLMLQAWHRSPRTVLGYEVFYLLTRRRSYTGKSGAVRQAISDLRHKFGSIGLDFDRWIVNVHGDGFRYDPPPRQKPPRARPGGVPAEGW
jgi:DNA-binding response OmpR family regulator